MTHLLTIRLANLRLGIARQPRIISSVLLSLMCLIGFLPGASAVFAAEAQGSAPALESLIEVALNYAERSIDERRRAIDEAQALLPADGALFAKQRAALDLALSYLHYQSGDLELAVSTLEANRAGLNKSNDPDLYVRSTALLAGLLNASGRQSKSLAMLEELFTHQFPQAQAKRVEYARANYASTLAELGRLNKASNAFEQVLRFAQSDPDDLLTLIAGTNYIMLLEDQGLTTEAEYWLKQLTPARTRLPNTAVSAGLELYEIGRLLDAGKTQTAMDKIQVFMAKPQQRSTLVSARSNLLYADALRAAGQLDASLQAAREALNMVANYPLRQPDAHFAIIQTLLAQEDYEASRKQLDLVETLELLKPASKATFQGLLLEQALRVGDTKQAEGAFEKYRAASQTLSDFVNYRQATYHHEKLRAQRAELELKLAHETQSLLTAEATAQRAQASELRTRIQTNLEQRHARAAVIAILALSVIGLLYFSARQNFQKRLQQELSDQNESLSIAVENKSKELLRKVTEQAKLKQVLAERNHMEAIGQIAGHVAHDFNNTLQVVSGANSLLEPLVATDSQKRVLSASNRSIHTGSATVKQLLAYSRKQQLESTVFRINHYLNSNAALFRSAIGEVNSLSIENLAGDTAVKLDSGQLTGSLINLMRNAADAMTTPGKIVLRVEHVSQPVAGSSPPQVLAQVNIKVTDEGEGMTTEVADRALEPYFSTKTEDLGTGLGLSSVYGFTTQSGGSISIQSEPGKGTTVTLCFPEYEGALEPGDSPEQGESMLNSVLNKARVLLVEDNSLIAQTMDALLNQEGAKTAWVDSAEAAREKLAAGSKFDLILSDINIRGAMNGFDFARWVESEHPDSQVGIMSGYGPTMEQNFDIPILAKPFTRDQLLAYLSDRGFVGARAS